MTLPGARLSAVAREIFEQALAECRIERAVERSVRSGTDEAGARLLRIGDFEVALRRVRHIRVVAAGKAAVPMVAALLPHLEGLPDTDLGGVLIAAEPPRLIPAGFSFFAGGHPLPNRTSFEGARAALQLIEPAGSGEEMLCLFLISGGASAMMELPLDAGITLEDTVSLYRELVHCGASITEINCVRKHFSAIKGGRLAMAARGSLFHTLLVSDVPPGHLDALASGPTLPDPSTVAECRAILQRHGLMERLPDAVVRFFTSPAMVETPKPGELTAHATILLSSDELAEAARRHAERMGFHAVIDNTCDDWEYRRAAVYLLDRLRSLRAQHGRVCLISAGEVTVKVTGSEHGVGGRNQHFALYAATLMTAGDAPFALLSAGSDGIDGNSPAAGAVVDERIASSSLLRSHAEAALQRFDSGTFLESLGATVVTGATGNNLRDLRLLLAG